MNVEYPRFQLPVLEKRLRRNPVVVIQGARQVGKTTLTRMIDGAVSEKEIVFTNLDDANTLRYAQEDQKSFLSQAKDGLLVIDETQRLPELLLGIKAVVDQSRRPGMFLLTGSADMLEVLGVADSLAGRLSRINLFPLSAGEVEHEPGRPHEDFVSFIQRASANDMRKLPKDSLEPRRILLGGYPEILLRQDDMEDCYDWVENYVQSLATHDAKEVFGVHSSGVMLGIIRRIAAEGIAEFNASKIARELDVSERTVRKYVEILTAMRLVHVVPAWSRNTAQRLIKRPKVMLNDSGLAMMVTKLHLEQLTAVGGREILGHYLEQFVVAELFKQQSWSATPFEIFHYRHRDGQKIDVLLETNDGTLIAIEVKLGATIHEKWLKNLTSFKQQYKDRKVIGVVLHGGDDVQHMHGWLHVLPISSLWRHGL